MFRGDTVKKWGQLGTQRVTSNGGLVHHSTTKYYFGSYGLIRGYGRLYRTLKEADDSVFDDGRSQRRHGGSTDRNAVAVDATTGLCWWLDVDDEDKDLDAIGLDNLIPVRTPSGAQAAYSIEDISKCEAAWLGPRELAGFG